jgi:hypothetical protein
MRVRSWCNTTGLTYQVSAVSTAWLGGPHHLVLGVLLELCLWAFAHGPLNFILLWPLRQSEGFHCCIEASITVEVLGGPGTPGTPGTPEPELGNWISGIITLFSCFHFSSGAKSEDEAFLGTGHDLHCKRQAEHSKLIIFSCTSSQLGCTQPSFVRDRSTVLVFKHQPHWITPFLKCGTDIPATATCQRRVAPVLCQLS